MDVDVIKELHEEGVRQGRPLSWLMQWAWRYAKVELRKYRPPP
jgi:uncharacterized small protein (TIGR04563 family)